MAGAGAAGGASAAGAGVAGAGVAGAGAAQGAGLFASLISGGFKALFGIFSALNPVGWTVLVLVCCLCCLCTTGYLFLSKIEEAPAFIVDLAGSEGLYATTFAEKHVVVNKDIVEEEIVWAGSGQNKKVKGVKYRVILTYDGKGDGPVQIKAGTAQDTFDGLTLPDAAAPGTTAIKKLEITDAKLNQEDLDLKTRQSNEDPYSYKIIGFPREEQNSRFKISYNMYVEFNAPLGTSGVMEDPKEGYVCNAIDYTMVNEGSESTAYDKICINAQGVVKSGSTCPFVIIDKFDRTDPEALNTIQRRDIPTKCTQGVGGLFSHKPGTETENSVDVSTSSAIYDILVQSPVDGEIVKVENSIMCRDGKDLGGGVTIQGDDGVKYHIIHIDPSWAELGRVEAGDELGVWSTNLTEGACWTGPHIHIRMEGTDNTDCELRNTFNCDISNRCPCSEDSEGRGVSCSYTCN